jgi:hypothetical protein
MATHFTGPVLENGQAKGAREFFANLPVCSSPDYLVYFNDFLAAQDYDAADWTITTTEAGTGDATEAASTTLAGGALVVTNDDGDADIDSLQLTTAPWRLSDGKRLWFETRLQLSNVAKSTLLVGLAITDTTPLDAADRVNFRISTGDASILCQADSTADAAVSTDSGADAADSTYVRLGFYYDGSSAIKYFVNRQLVASTTSAIPANDKQLHLTLHLANAATAPDATKAVTVDYFYVCQER